MEILGIGAPELIFIILIALIVLGPKDMQKAGRTIGRWLNQLIRSDSWKVFQRTSAELRNLPRNLMREANMEVAEMERDLRNAIDPRSDPANRTASTPKPSDRPHTIAAPRVDSSPDGDTQDASDKHD
jgi:sec-independent protein translocase protein TatB